MSHLSIFYIEKLKLTFKLNFSCSISYILQADIFEEASDGFEINMIAQHDLQLNTLLPSLYGGDISPRDISPDVMLRETSHDPELRLHIEAGNVPTVDTIFR